MFAQVDPNTFGLNLYLIIGALIFLAAASGLLISAWTAVNSALWFVRRRCADNAHRRRTFRADGKRYPGFMVGMCTECHRGDRTIYYPPATDKELCPPCYERHWRHRKVCIKPESQAELSNLTCHLPP